MVESSVESSVKSSGQSNLLNRPESVMFVLVATLFVLWETYLSLLDEAGSDSLSSRQLAQRLGTTQKIIRRRKSQPGFSEWTQQLDPDGIAWSYRTGGVYEPAVQAISGR